MRRLTMLALSILIAACGSPSAGSGVLEGHVSIGPLVPVLREGEPEPTPAPEVYAARQILVFTENGRSEVARAQIDGRGNYRLVLPAGVYAVDINRIGIDRGIDLPKTVRIQVDQVTRLDIEIDTGIR